MADAETDRTAVKTYVPRDQKEAWQEEAAELGMTQSEYVRTMVQAGRRGFVGNPENDDETDASPGGEGLEDRVLRVLDPDSPRAWGAIVDELTEDLEERLEAALESLQDDGRVRYEGHRGGYVLGEE